MTKLQDAINAVKEAQDEQHDAIVAVDILESEIKEHLFRLFKNGQLSLTVAAETTSERQLFKSALERWRDAKAIRAQATLVADLRMDEYRDIAKENRSHD